MTRPHTQLRLDETRLAFAAAQLRHNWLRNFQSLGTGPELIARRRRERHESRASIDQLRPVLPRQQRKWRITNEVVRPEVCRLAARRMDQMPRKRHKPEEIIAKSLSAKVC